MAERITITSLDQLTAVVDACISSGGKPVLDIAPHLFADHRVYEQLERILDDHPASNRPLNAGAQQQEEVVSHSYDALTGQEHRGVGFRVEQLGTKFRCRVQGVEPYDIDYDSAENAAFHARAYIDQLLQPED